MNDLHPLKGSRLTKKQLNMTIAEEAHIFEQFYLWLEKHMPTTFFEELNSAHLMTITHNLMGFNQQGMFIQIHFEACSIVLCLEGPDADIKILKNYGFFGIKNYQTFVSDQPPPFDNVKKLLRVAILHFTTIEKESNTENKLDPKIIDAIFNTLKNKHQSITKKEIKHILSSINSQFFHGVTVERLTMAIDVFFRSLKKELIQYEVKYNEDWKKNHKDVPSMQLVFAWSNTQKHNFLYRLSKLIFRHNLTMKRVNASYVKQTMSSHTLLMSVGIHGQKNKPAWEMADLNDFLRELATLKYFPDNDLIAISFTNTKILTGNFTNLLRAIASLTHQLLLHVDANMYTLRRIEEGFCEQKNLTIVLCKLFEEKFHPKKRNIQQFVKTKDRYISMVKKIDTGNLFVDKMRKKILLTAADILVQTDKTNFYRTNKSAIIFRMQPQILAEYEAFDELPFAIFFLQGNSFIGFHIRFKDIARGGLRTIFPKTPQQGIWERDNILTECYNLAYTQQNKNKDIPEGGSKALIFLEPFEEIEVEITIYNKELILSDIPNNEIEEKIDTYKKEQRIAQLYQAQKAFTYNLLILINFKEDGSLVASNIVDYYKKPEYIYLGPDENMHNPMIQWISEYSQEINYKLGSAFISSKPIYGINHKEFGVTSLGVNVYVEEMLKYIGINPKKDKFTVKMSGGPDGDVAGNQILNFYRYYPKTAQLLAVTDASGTIYSPKGLLLKEMVKLFKSGKSIRHYPVSKLTNEGFLLDLESKKTLTSYSSQTLCYKKVGNKIVKTWLSGDETHHIYTKYLHQVKTDIFVPAGGRPQTLSQDNWKDFLDTEGLPTSRAIVEAANLYLTNQSRKLLEEKGVLIVQDSSANKGGVICSSMEVLTSLILTQEEFLKTKIKLMKDILSTVEKTTRQEAKLLFLEHKKSNKPLTEISYEISKKINKFTYILLDYLQNYKIDKQTINRLNKCLLKYCPNTLVKNYKSKIFEKIPEIHQKAIVASFISSHIIYNNGVSWNPSITDILPLIIKKL